MLNWKNYDKLAAAEKLAALKDKVCLQEAMAGEQGAARVAAYCAPMAAGLCYNYAAKAVDEDVLADAPFFAAAYWLSVRLSAVSLGSASRNRHISSRISIGICSSLKYWHIVA